MTRKLKQKEDANRNEEQTLKMEYRKSPSCDKLRINLLRDAGKGLVPIARLKTLQRTVPTLMMRLQALMIQKMNPSLPC